MSKRKRLTPRAQEGPSRNNEVNEDFESEEAKEVANAEPTMYDSLLKKLGSRNASVADALRRR